MAIIRPLLFIGMAALLFGLDPASAAEYRCSGSAVDITAVRTGDVDDVCEAITFATKFLESVGLNLPPSVSIRLVSEPEPSFLGEAEVGRFNSTQSSIAVLDHQAAVKATSGSKGGLGRIVTRSHWRSYIVHELAHATIHMNRGMDCPSRSIHEYLASVAQISAIPPRELDMLMSEYRDLVPFSGADEISEIYYAINPHAFAVKAYKHYLQLIDPRAFLQKAMGLSIE